MKVLFKAYQFLGILAQQSFIETPRNLSVVLGGEAILKCSIKGQKGEVTWCKDDSFCTFGRKRNFTDERISLMGDATKGDHNLLIKSVTLVDDTKYQCQVTASESDPAIKSDWAFLTVLSLPTSINITSNNKEDTSLVVLIKNQSTTLECNADNANPPCILIWYLDSVELKANSEVSGLTNTSK